MSQKRSNRKERPDPDLSAELDDMLAAPALRPSLRFLGFPDETASPGVASSPAVIPIRPQQAIVPFPAPVSPSPDVIPPPADIEQEPPVITAPPADITSPAVIKEDPSSPEITQTASPVITTSPAVTASPVYTTPPADTASPDVTRSAVNPRKRIHRCVKVQDGHSHIEQAVYQILWNSGAAQADGNRISRLGLPRIAKEACVHERNIGIIIRRLIQKQAIEIVQREVSDLRVSRVYKVFGYREILERRRQAGLEWVVRGRGVEFVDGVTGTPVFSEKPTITAGDAITAPLPTAVTAPESPAITPPDPPAVTPGLLEKKLLRNNTEESSSSEKSAVAEAFRQYAQPDDDAVQLLIARCRAQASDCTPEEIAEFLHRKALLLRGTGIVNPTGFLLTAVPKCFSGETFRLYREEQQRKKREAEAAERQRVAELESWRAEQEAILDDPASSEEDRQWARKLLELG